MKCQKCGGTELLETTVSVPVKTPRGKVIIGDVPAVRCLECGSEFMSMIARSQVKKIFDRWAESGEPGNKIIKYSLLGNTNETN